MLRKSKAKAGTPFRTHPEDSHRDQHPYRSSAACERKTSRLRECFSQRHWMQVWEFFIRLRVQARQVDFTTSIPFSTVPRWPQAHQRSNKDARRHVDTPALKCQSEANPSQDKTATIENIYKSADHLLTKIISPFGAGYFFCCFILYFSQDFCALIHLSSNIRQTQHFPNGISSIAFSSRWMSKALSEFLFLVLDSFNANVWKI